VWEAPVELVNTAPDLQGILEVTEAWDLSPGWSAVLVAVV